MLVYSKLSKLHYSFGLLKSILIKLPKYAWGVYIQGSLSARVKRLDGFLYQGVRDQLVRIQRCSFIFFYFLCSPRGASGVLYSILVHLTASKLLPREARTLTSHVHRTWHRSQERNRARLQKHDDNTAQLKTYSKGLAFTYVGLLAQCSIPFGADVPIFRIVIVALDAVLNCLLWTMQSTHKSIWGRSYVSLVPSMNKLLKDHIPGSIVRWTRNKPIFK